MNFWILVGFMALIGIIFGIVWIFRPVMIPFLLAKKRRMPILHLQTPTMDVVKVPIQKIDNLYKLSETEYAIAPPHSIKTSTLGVMTGTGDYYCGLLSSEDVISLFGKFRAENKTIKDFNKFIEKIAEDEVKEKGEPIHSFFGKTKAPAQKERIIYKIIDYSKIKDFVNIGLNPTLISLQQKNAEYINLLKSLRGTDWMKIVMPIVILIVIALVVWMMVGGGAAPDIVSSGKQVIESVAPTVVNPGG